MIRIFKNLLLQNQESIEAEFWYKASGGAIKVYQVCSNDDPWMTFDLFTALSNFFPSCCGNTGRFADMQWLFYSSEQIVAHGPLVSSPEHEVLKVTYCDQSMSGMRQQQFALKPTPPSSLGQMTVNLVVSIGVAILKIYFSLLLLNQRAN